MHPPLVQPNGFTDMASMIGKLGAAVVGGAALAGVYFYKGGIYTANAKQEQLVGECQCNECLLLFYNYREEFSSLK